MSRMSTALLVAAAAGLGLLTTQLALTPVDTSATPPPAAGESAPGSASSTPDSALKLDTTTPGDFPQTTARPLFWPTRRPQPPQTANTPPRPSPPSATAPQPAAVAFRLAGIFNDGSKVRRALIVWPQLPEGRWIEVGGQIEGWRLAGIEPHGVRIEAGGRSVELKLH